MFITPHIFCANKIAQVLALLLFEAFTSTLYHPPWQRDRARIDPNVNVDF